MRGRCVRVLLQSNFFRAKMHAPGEIGADVSVGVGTPRARRARITERGERRRPLSASFLPPATHDAGLGKERWRWAAHAEGDALGFAANRSTPQVAALDSGMLLHSELLERQSQFGNCGRGWGVHNGRSLLFTLYSH